MFDVSNVDPAKKPPVRKKRKIPRSGGPAAWKAVSGLVLIGLFMGFSGSYYPSMLTADSFVEYGLLRRIWSLYMVSFTARLKYYGVWYLTEGSCILAGLGYNGVDPVTGKISWNRLQNIDPWAVETAQNPRGYLGGWNINTNNWLRNYVYLRVTPRGKKPGFRASLMTFGTSALWHGFYPGYYLSFVLASFIQTAAKRESIKSYNHIDMLTSSRLPPSRPPLLPRPRNRKPHPQEEVLRLRNLPRHPAHLHLCHGALPGPLPQGLSPSLVPRLLLRHRLDRPVPDLLPLPRQARPQEAAREASG
jgi:lysophospholipid acyltransferase